MSMKFYVNIVLVGLLCTSGCLAMQQSSACAQSSTSGSTSAVTNSIVITVSDEPRVQVAESTYGEAWLRYGQYCQNARMQSTSAASPQRNQNDHHLVLPSDETWIYAERQRQAEQQVVRSAVRRSELQIFMQILRMIADKQKENVPNNRVAALSSGSWRSISSPSSTGVSVSSSNHNHNAVLVKLCSHQKSN